VGCNIQVGFGEDLTLRAENLIKEVTRKAKWADDEDAGQEEARLHPEEDTVVS
jgi:hypothetical protein